MKDDLAMIHEITHLSGKEDIMQLVDYVGNNQQHFDQIFALCLSNDQTVASRAAWVFNHCDQNYPQLTTPHFGKMIETIGNTSSDAIKRNFLRILAQKTLPEPLWGEAADHCFRLLKGAGETIAVKVFAMTILFKITLEVPELKEELIWMIEEQMPFGSAGFRNRGKKIMDALRKGKRKW